MTFFLNKNIYLKNYNAITRKITRKIGYVFNIANKAFY